ncbi:DUF559 domain-containing protein [Xanthobacter dioxanivorans]|uniref:DUF559 domain-containing protein n=1 Tax=Xanthobacter dioxanivorans TaxID=2528964 RepID=A0A974SGR0_9HYPH|nr:DUF559 domain-containing protein [Xanthobacter dioxanivorans]QRG04597.1 DUF559 domain-containing protein [Xanthobacter dioxanivorans]
MSAHLLRARDGDVLAIDGARLDTLRAVFDAVEPASGQSRLLFLALPPSPSATEVIEKVIARLAEVALRLWPTWYQDVEFPRSGTDTLARLAATATARRAAGAVPGVLSTWAEAAALLALEGRAPHVPHTPDGTQLSQLARLIGPDGLVLVAEVPPVAPAGPQAAALVHGLEWIARHMRGAVAALFPEPPADGSPFDRIRHRPYRLAADGAAPQLGGAAPALAGRSERARGEGAQAEVWLLPWRGRPHPLSEVEQRLARLLGADGELGPLFSFNQVVETVRGSRPRVDLLWAEGRLVVELDGYADHGTRTAFVRDRHRDYELTLSGYTVLRLPNEEVVQDCGLALEKIRDLVRRRRKVLPREG